MRPAAFLVLALMIVPAVASAGVMHERPRVTAVGGTLYPTAGIALVETTQGGAGFRYQTNITSDGAHASLVVVVCTWHGFDTIPEHCPRYELAA